jgi:hypothetical protein
MLAYLDANSGSLIASAIAAGFAGIAVVFKMGWSRTLGFFSPKRRRAAKAAAAEGDATDSITESTATEVASDAS